MTGYTIDQEEQGLRVRALSPLACQDFLKVYMTWTSSILNHSLSMRPRDGELSGSVVECLT